MRIATVLVVEISCYYNLESRTNYLNAVYRFNDVEIIHAVCTLVFIY